jgi:transposase InsO family protein
VDVCTRVAVTWRIVTTLSSPPNETNVEQLIAIAIAIFIVNNRSERPPVLRVLQVRSCYRYSTALHTNPRLLPASISAAKNLLRRIFWPEPR